MIPAPVRSRPSTHWLKVPPYREPAGEYFSLGPPLFCANCCYFDKFGTQNCAQLDQPRQPEDRACIWGRAVISLHEALARLTTAMIWNRHWRDPPTPTFYDDEIPF